LRRRREVLEPVHAAVLAVEADEIVLLSPTRKQASVLVVNETNRQPPALNGSTTDLLGGLLVG